MSKINQFVSVVAYVHNNAAEVEKFINTVMTQCEKFKQREIVFVDDCSIDDSVEKIKEYYKENPSDYIVNIIRMSQYHGMEAAMNCGRDLAIGDFVYEFDDLFVDYDGSVIIDAYNKCVEGNDVVSVSTDVPIRMTSKIFYKLFNSTNENKTKIGQESFRLLSRRGINRIASMNVDIPFRKAVYFNCGLSVGTITYKSLTGERPARITENTERIDLALDSFIYFTKLVERLSLFLSGFFCLLFLSLVIYFLIASTIGQVINVTWMIVVLLTSLGFCGIFILLGIAIKYLDIIVDLNFKRKKYLISDVEKISFK